MVAASLVLVAAMAARPAMPWAHFHTLASEHAAHIADGVPDSDHDQTHAPAKCGTCFELLLAKYAAGWAAAALLPAGTVSWPAAEHPSSIPRAAPDVAEAPPRGPPSRVA